MARPDALGLTVTIKSIDDVELCLAELGWLKSQKTRLDAQASQAIEQIKTDSNAKAVVEIEDSQVTIADRIALIEQVLEKWLGKNVSKHLDGEKKSIDLAHGTVGLRQSQLSVTLPKGTDDEVLAKIDGVAKGFCQKIRDTLVRLVKGFGSIHEMVNLKVSVNISGIKKALKEKRTTKENVESLGLVVTEPTDEPYFTPTEFDLPK